MRTQCCISDESLSELQRCVEKCIVPKRTQIVKEGTFTRYAYFIEKGLTRSFWMVDGEEITTSFSCEGAMVFSMDELYYGKRSEEYVETLEDCEMYRIALTDLLHLWDTNLEFCRWARVIHQNEYRRLHQSHKERLTLPAKERYEEFIKQFPYVLQRTNLSYVASYLGITLSTLSRLRGSK